MNPHPIIFPKLIRLYNENPQAYYGYLGKLWVHREEANHLLKIIQVWIEETNYTEYLNDS